MTFFKKAAAAVQIGAALAGGGSPQKAPVNNLTRQASGIHTERKASVERVLNASARNNNSSSSNSRRK
jgi:hypothetical protein